MSLETFRLFPHKISWQGTRNSWYVFHYILRLEGASEQDEVKQGVTYCIIIQEDQQIGSTSDCCIPKVGRWKSKVEEERKMNNNIHITTCNYWKWKQGLTLHYRRQVRHQVQKCAEQKWVESLFQSLGGILDPWNSRENHLDFSHSAMRNHCLFRVLVLEHEIEKKENTLGDGGSTAL